MATIWWTKWLEKIRSKRDQGQVIYNILDLAVINAWILYQEVIKKKISRRKFLLKLWKELAASDVGSGQVKLIKMTYCWRKSLEEKENNAMQLNAAKKKTERVIDAKTIYAENVIKLQISCMQIALNHKFHLWFPLSNVYVTVI